MVALLARRSRYVARRLRRQLGNQRPSPGNRDAYDNAAKVSSYQADILEGGPVITEERDGSRNTEVLVGLAPRVPR